MYTEKPKCPKSYTTDEVMSLFGVNRDTVIRMIQDGRLDGEKVGRRYLITEESIKRLVKEGNSK